MTQPPTVAVASQGSDLSGCCPASPAQSPIHIFSKSLAQLTNIPAALVAGYLANRIQATKRNSASKAYRINLRALQSLYPYLSRGGIDNALQLLTKQGILSQQNTNKRKLDRTRSYEFTSTANLKLAMSTPIYLDTSEATAYGVNEAIILHNLRHWLNRPDAGPYHVLSPTILHEHLPLTVAQISRAIKVLMASKAIEANPAIPPNRPQQYRIIGSNRSPAKMDKHQETATTASPALLDTSPKIMDASPAKMDTSPKILDNNIHYIADIEKPTLKEDCYEMPPTTSPAATNVVFSPFAALPEMCAAPQSSVTRAPDCVVAPRRNYCIYPPLPTSPVNALTASLPASWKEAQELYRKTIYPLPADQRDATEEAIVQTFSTWIKSCDGPWLDQVAVARTPEDLYQHLKQFADHGIPAHLRATSVQLQAIDTPLLHIWSVVFLTHAFLHFHPSHSHVIKYPTYWIPRLNWAIQDKVNSYRAPILKARFEQKRSEALARLDELAIKHRSPESHLENDAGLSAAQKAKVLRSSIDAHNACGYVDAKAEIHSGTLTYDDTSLKAARTFFTHNPDLTANDVAVVLSSCESHTTSHKPTELTEDYTVSHSINLGYLLLNFNQVLVKLGMAHIYPSIVSLDAAELFPHSRK